MPVSHARFQMEQIKKVSALCYTFCYKIAVKIIRYLSFEVIMLFKRTRKPMYTLFIKTECILSIIQRVIVICLTHSKYRRFDMNGMIVFFLISIVIDKSECMM